jgi:hypothetical protein
MFLTFYSLLQKRLHPIHFWRLHIDLDCRHFIRIRCDGSVRHECINRKHPKHVKQLFLKLHPDIELHMNCMCSLGEPRQNTLGSYRSLKLCMDWWTRETQTTVADLQRNIYSLLVFRSRSEKWGQLGHNRYQFVEFRMLPPLHSEGS